MQFLQQIYNVYFLQSEFNKKKYLFCGIWSFLIVSYLECITQRVLII